MGQELLARERAKPDRHESCAQPALQSPALRQLEGSGGGRTRVHACVVREGVSERPFKNDSTLAQRERRSGTDRCAGNEEPRDDRRDRLFGRRLPHPHGGEKLGGSRVEHTIRRRGSGCTAFGELVRLSPSCPPSLPLSLILWRVG